MTGNGSFNDISSFIRPPEMCIYTVDMGRNSEALGSSKPCGGGSDPWVMRQQCEG